LDLHVTPVGYIDFKERWKTPPELETFGWSHGGILSRVGYLAAFQPLTQPISGTLCGQLWEGLGTQTHIGGTQKRAQGSPPLSFSIRTDFLRAKRPDSHFRFNSLRRLIISAQLLLFRPKFPNFVKSPLRDSFARASLVFPARVRAPLESLATPRVSPKGSSSKVAPSFGAPPLGV